MKRKNATRSALFTSVISMLLCISMLVGTTFAWFTDSVESGENIIKSGNLDIELEYWNGTKWADVKDASDILTGNLWEPGYVDVAYLRMKNAGSLALKYQLGVNIVSETEGVNQKGETFKLSDSIYFGVVEGVNGETGAYEKNSAGRAKAISDVDTAKKLNEGYTKAATMTAGQDALYLALVVYMPTTVGNEANHNGEDIPAINLGISVFATQQMSENDSFGDDYDKGAAWTGLVDIDWYLDAPDATEYVLTSGEELAGLAAIVNGTAVAPVATYAAGEATTIKDNFKGKTIKLGADIDLHDVEWTPIGDNPNPFLGNFDGQGYTVSNLYVNNEGWSGLIGHAGKSAGCTIKNVTIDGATIFSNRMAGAVVGQLYGSIDNCHVKDATIIVVPNAVGDSYDNGDKVGGIVGWLGDNGNNRTLTNCTAEDVDVGGYRDIGGIAGYVASSTTVKGNSAKGVVVTVDQTTNYYGDKDVNAGYIVGRANGTITEENNTNDEACVIDSTYSMNGLTVKADGKGNVVLWLVPETYEATTLNVPAGVTALRNKLLMGNTTMKEVVIPSTVTDFGGTPNAAGTGASGGFFYQSAVEKVVLPEGLTEIPAATFNQAANLKEVNIPSTVTTIGINAFAGSGLSELTVPATVTSIGYGAFRDMANLTTVTIEGDSVYIPDYAFRNCGKLTTVFLNANSLTLQTGNMAFCNTSTNNEKPNNITIYVKNEDVYNTLANNKQIKCTIVVATAVSSADELKTALAAGGSAVLGADVEMEAATTAPYGNKYAVKLDGGVLDGNGNELNVECYGDDYGIMTSGGTIKNLTIKEGCRAVMIMYPQSDIILDNVNIGGDGVLYPINTGEAGAEGVKLIVTNSTLAGWTSYGLIESASFTNVEFKQGTYYNNIYGRVLKPYVNTTLTNCSFVEHMNLDLSALANGHKVTMTNCTVNGQPVTAETFTVPTTDSQYDTELFTVDLPSWATSINDCIVFG